MDTGSNENSTCPRHPSASVCETPAQSTSDKAILLHACMRACAYVRAFAFRGIGVVILARALCAVCLYCWHRRLGLGRGRGFSCWCWWCSSQCCWRWRCRRCWCLELCMSARADLCVHQPPFITHNNDACACLREDVVSVGDPHLLQVT